MLENQNFIFIEVKKWRLKSASSKSVDKKMTGGTKRHVINVMTETKSHDSSFTEIFQMYLNNPIRLLW